MLFLSELRMRCKSWSDSLLSSERSPEDVVFVSASIQTTIPFRERSRRLRALCLRISYFLLHSPSVSQVPPRRICQINSIACRQEIWRCHRCGGKRRLPPRHGMAGHGRVWQTETHPTVENLSSSFHFESVISSLSKDSVI